MSTRVAVSLHGLSWKLSNFVSHRRKDLQIDFLIGIKSNGHYGIGEFMVVDTILKYSATVQ